MSSTMFDPVTAREAIHVIVTLGLGAALIRFGMLERRAHRRLAETARQPAQGAAHRARPHPGRACRAGRRHAARPSTRSRTACSRRRRLWRSSSPRRSASASSSCSGSSADRRRPRGSNRPARSRMSARCMPQPGRNMPSIADLAADAVGALVVGIGVGADRQIAALAVVDAFAPRPALRCADRASAAALRSTS